MVNCWHEASDNAYLFLANAENPARHAVVSGTFPSRTSRVWTLAVHFGSEYSCSMHSCSTVFLSACYYSRRSIHMLGGEILLWNYYWSSMSFITSPILYVNHLLDSGFCTVDQSCVIDIHPPCRSEGVCNFDNFLYNFSSGLPRRQAAV